MGLCCLSEYSYRGDRSLIGSLLPFRRQALLDFVPKVFSSRSPPRRFGFLSEDHPPIDLHSPSEFHRSSPPSYVENLADFDCRTASSHEVRSPTTLEDPEAHFTRVYLARYVPPSGFPPSRRFASPGTRRPCFMPTTFLGFSLQSFSLGKEPAILFGLPLPSCRYRVRPLRCYRKSEQPKSVWNSTRLQGLDPLPKCATRMVGATLQIRAGALLGFSPLQGFLPSRDGPCFQGASPFGTAWRSMS